MGRPVRILALVLQFCAAPAALSQGSEYFFPQVADGRSGSLFYSTSVMFNNAFDAENAITISFFRSNGTPWPVDLRSQDRPELAGRRSTLTFTLRRFESALVFSGGADPLGVGWARVDADLPVVVSEVFGVFESSPVSRLISEAGVLPSPTATAFSFFATVSSNEPVNGTNIDTGFALINPGAADAVIRATLSTRGGAVLSTRLITLNANSHTAIFVSQVFNDVSFTGQFHGMVQFSSNVNIGAVAIRQASGNSDTIATVPVTPDSSNGFSILYDQEPNDTLASAQRLFTLPAEIIGTMNAPDDGADLDLFSISLQAGDLLYVMVIADFINSPLNDSIFIRNPAGNIVAEVDTFSAGLFDPFIRYQVPATGIYYIDHGSVGGTSSRGSYYRLHVLVKSP